MTEDFVTTVTPALTLENARTYTRQTNKYVWVCNLLTELDICPTDMRVMWVEDRLDEVMMGGNSTIHMRGKAYRLTADNHIQVRDCWGAWRMLAHNANRVRAQFWAEYNANQKAGAA